MAINDIRIISTGGVDSLPEMTYQTEANATQVLPGVLVKGKSTGSPYVIALADGDGVIGTTTQILGLATSTDTRTASVDGTVRVARINANTVLRCKAKTAANIDTAAELLAIAGDYYVIDVTTDVHTMDLAGGHNLANAFVATGTGDIAKSELDFTVRATALMGPVA